jgi:uncharacterized membrane protein YeaQ/YmgE (transglycosylase-associated protein family)
VQVIWAIIVGAIVGFIARWISPSPHNPQGFVLTTVLGIIGSVVATLLGRAIHLYGPDQSAGIIASIVSGRLRPASVQSWPLPMSAVVATAGRAAWRLLAPSVPQLHLHSVLVFSFSPIVGRFVR